MVLNENTNLLELCQFASSYQNLPFGDCRNFHRYLIWILEWPRAILKVVTIQSQPWGIDKILIRRKITNHHPMSQKESPVHAGCYVYTRLITLQMQKYKSKHLKGQLWPRVRDVFAYSCPAPPPLVSCDPAFVTFLLIPAYDRNFMFFHFLDQKFWLPAPNCILAQRSSLGPPPGGRHRT